MGEKCIAALGNETCVSVVLVHSFFLYIVLKPGIGKLDRMVDDTLCALSTGVILKGPTLRKSVSDVCIYMYVLCL